jgi:hypothetical protein
VKKVDKGGKDRHLASPLFWESGKIGLYIRVSAVVAILDLWIQKGGETADLQRNHRLDPKISRNL